MKRDGPRARAPPLCGDGDGLLTGLSRTCVPVSERCLTPADKRTQREDLRAELASLVDRVRRRDQAALARLYDDTAACVHGVISRILHDPQMAEETTLDVYLQVWNTADSYTARRGSPLAWILTIARSRAIDRLRSVAAHRRREKSFAESLEFATRAQDDPELSVVSEERRERVAAAIVRLPEDQRRAIELAFFQGLSHSEIAARLGSPLGTIKSQIRLGMVKLRSVLTPAGAEP